MGLRLKRLYLFDYSKLIKVESVYVFLFSVRRGHDMVKSLFNFSFLWGF